MIDTVSRTDRLVLHRPSAADVDDVFALLSDPLMWEHYPSPRHAERVQSEALVDSWQSSWEERGLGMWVVRDEDGALHGIGGSAVRHGTYWNLAYKLSPGSRGRGLASELARAGVAAARRTDGDLPIVATTLGHNTGSSAVARRAGLVEVHRGPDVSNPTPGVTRLVFADRELSQAALAAAMTW